MVKNNKKSNALIKKNNLVYLMNNLGIKRINPQAINVLNKKLENQIQIIIRKLKQNMDINARKTLMKQDVLNVLESKQKDEEFVL